MPHDVNIHIYLYIYIYIHVLIFSRHVAFGVPINTRLRNENNEKQCFPSPGNGWKKYTDGPQMQSHSPPTTNTSCAGQHPPTPL